MARMARTAAQRRAGRDWARWSADNAIKRSSSELIGTRHQLLQFQRVLELLIGDPEVADRISCVVPVLQALAAGLKPADVDVLRRNVAMHAKASGVSLATAPWRL
ncbi:unnamed protein product [Prorocentrum cordatum]|uniref:Uncharacterized protein n=1 Tax=Prorocentrum cordatum TaxID=2364126 RepID=A0ABN9QY21_9DINO|nr:unnamed protein product [Polarella glacialis]